MGISLPWYTRTILGGTLNQPRYVTSGLGLILGIVLISGLAWGNYRFARQNSSGEGFFIQWVAVRSLITGGESPYSNEVTAKIQASVKFENSFAPGGPPRYTAPLLSAIVVLPFAVIVDSTLAHALWLSAQLIALFLIQLLALRLVAWKPAWYLFLVFLLLTTFSYHVFIPWLDGGLSIWSSLFLVIAFTAIHDNWNEVGGVFLALSAIQPQMVILVIIFTLFWAIAQRKITTLLWFFITLVVLSVVGLFLVPDWILQYFRILLNYPSNFPPGSPGVLFKDLWPGLGKQFGWVITTLAAIVLLLEWWRARKKDFRWFLWTACLTLAVSPWIGIPTIPGNFTGLLLPLILIFSLLIEHWNKGGQWIIGILLLVLFVWEWGLFYRDFTSPFIGTQLNLLIPLPLVLIVGLYWIRWWAIKPRRLLIEELKLGETY